MRVLVLGSGGREHALCWKIAQSSLLEKLFVAPGNAGTMSEGENVELNISDFKAVEEFVAENHVDVVVVGPEEPLVNGIHDFLAKSEKTKNVTVIGPKKSGARLEGSKDFAKQFMIKHGIPTAKYKSFSKNDLQSGFEFLETLHPPFVLKADGLAAGKGVLIIEDLEEAKTQLREMLQESKFGKASGKVVIEEYLKGTELSVFVITDGTSYKILPAAKDYKRIGEGDTGLNTGGMGAVSPVSVAREDFLQKVEDQIIKPTIWGLQKDKIEYQGFLFIGLMMVKGDPYVIEYNVRMGDPETEVVMTRLKSDLLDLFEGIATETLSERHIETDERTAVTVVMVSGGYPENYVKGKVISGLENVSQSRVFHSGTTLKDGKVVTAGGRVLAVTSLGKDLDKALDKTYQSIEEIEYENKYYRKDIGFDLKKVQKA